MGLFFRVLLPRWLLEAPKALKSKKNYKKHEENATLFSSFWASTVACQAKFTATVTAMMGLFLHFRCEVDLLHLQVPNIPRLAGAAGRLHGGCADQNKPMATVTAIMDLFWFAHPT